MLKKILPVAAVMLAVPHAAGAQNVARVVLQPPSMQLAVGAREPVVAQAMASNNAVIPTASFDWSSTNISVARVIDFDPMVSSIATIEALSPGLVTIEVRSGGQVGRLTVQVTGGGGGGVQRNNPPRENPPVQTSDAELLQVEPAQVSLLLTESVNLRPQFLRADGSAARPESITWTSLQPSVANVNSETGEVIAISAGNSLIQGTSASGLVVRVPVRVGADAIAFDRVAVSVAPGMIDTLHAIVPSQNNRVIPATSLRWRSQNTSVVRVSPLGIVSGVGPGSTEIVATGFFQEIRIPASVHPEVVDLVFSPSASTPVYLPINGTREFSVEARDGNDNPVPEAVLLWLAGDTSVVGFDPRTATATGKRLGVDTLRVRAPGAGRLEIAWEIRVIAGGLLLGTDRAGLAIGDGLLVPAEFTDDAGNPISSATAVNWTSSAPTVVSVAPNGNLTGVGVGRAQVYATTPWGSADTIDVFVQAELFVSSNRAGSFDLYSLNRNQLGTLYRLTDYPDIEANAAMSPDRTRIAFVSNALGNNDIYVANADGSDPVAVTSGAGQDDFPAWTADGSRIVYQSTESGTPQIWIMNADGSNKVQLTAGPANAQPSVSLDDRIAFSSVRDGNYEIYSMALNGSNLVNMTNTSDNERVPQWLPDGGLAYVSETRVVTGNRRGQTRTSMRVTLLRGGGVSFLTPPNYNVTDFAISRSGDLVAMIVSEFTSAGVNNRLMLHQVGSSSPPIEVRPTIPGEQYIGVAFRP
ncbi:MAG: TolB family protein [Gemmatimonadales bacterium]